VRIAYLARCDASSESGVLKKLVSQVATWRAAGHEASLFIHSRNTGVWPPAASSIESVVRETGWLSRGFRLSSLTSAIERWKPDVVYARFDTGSRALSAMMLRIPTVLELNTDDLAEYRLYLPRYQFIYHRASRGETLRCAAGFVAVTHEIAERFASFGHPMAVIANGIDLSEFTPLPASEGESLRLVFMGSPGASWHGVDKIIALARRLPDVHFDLIGPGATTGLPANVTARGMLSSDDYRHVLMNSDAAIGTLAMHRNSMSEGSTLKVREYLAMGLPCIIGYRDTDFPEPVPFLLQLPNTDDNAVSEAAAIRQFCAEWHGKRIDRRAIEHLDMRNKEAQRLEFMSSLIERPTFRSGSLPGNT